jgi:hypothetical protein
MAFEQVQLGIKGVRQVEALNQQQTGSQSPEASSFDLGGVVVDNVLIGEEAATLLLPLPFPQTAFDAAFTVAQTLLDTTLALGLSVGYLGLHLKYLAQQGIQAIRLTSLFSGTAEVFQGYVSCPTLAG